MASKSQISDATNNRLLNRALTTLYDLPAHRNPRFICIADPREEIVLRAHLAPVSASSHAILPVPHALARAIHNGRGARAPARNLREHNPRRTGYTEPLEQLEKVALQRPLYLLATHA